MIKYFFILFFAFSISLSAVNFEEVPLTEVENIQFYYVEMSNYYYPIAKEIFATNNNEFPVKISIDIMPKKNCKLEQEILRLEIPGK